MPEAKQRNSEIEGTIPDPPNRAIIRMDTWLFLVSLAVFFISSVIGIVIIRNATPNWGEGAPPFPSIAWLSTAVILLLSIFSEIGIYCVKRDYQAIFKACMGLVLILGFVFLFLQEMVWQQLLAYDDGSFNASSSLLAWCVYVLGLIHALHLAGGLIFQSYVTVHAAKGGFWSLHHDLVNHVNIYWHFLAGIWFGLFAFLLWLV